MSLIEPAVRTLGSDLPGVASLLEEYGINEKLLLDPEARVSSYALTSLLDFGVQTYDDPTFPARAGLNVRPGQYGLFEWLIRTSDTAKDMQPRLERNFELIGDLEAPSFEVRDAVALVIHRQRSNAPPPRVIDYILANWLAVARTIGGSDVGAQAVWFTRADSDHREALRDVFECDLLFGRDVNALAFPSDAFEQDLGRTDPVVANAVEKRAEEIVRGIRSGRAVSQRVDREIVVRLPQDGATLESVSVALKMSERTLRRRLKAENTSFKELRDAVRLREARRRLADTSASIGEIAFDLGFADPAAFHRAFKRWTGETPTQARVAAEKTDTTKSSTPDGQ